MVWHVKKAPKKNVNGLSLLLFPFFNELLLFAINLLPVAGRKEAASSRLEALPRKLEKGYSIHLHLDGVGKNTYLLAWASCRTPKKHPSVFWLQITLLSGETSFAGLWFRPLWKILVSWDHYSQYMEKWKMFQTTNQFVVGIIYLRFFAAGGDIPICCWWYPLCLLDARVVPVLVLNLRFGSSILHGC